MRKTPPPTKRRGADVSIASATAGSLLKVANNASIGPSVGLTAQTIAHGKRPRTTNTAKRIPQIKNHRRAFSPIVERTSALMIALSILLIASNKQSPATMRIIEKISMEVNKHQRLINIPFRRHELVS